MKKIIIASDSFKGSLSSAEVAVSCEKGIRKVFPKCEIIKLPIADGGEGTIEALVSATNGRIHSCHVHDPLMRLIEARYGVLGDGETAVIEMAAASGLTLIEPHLRNPMKTTTYGTGELIQDALEHGCRKFLIGIGGSATNDAGTGMLQALGMKFRDIAGNLLGYGGEILQKIEMIDSNDFPEDKLAKCTFTIACDVNNPFSGPQGAAFIFAPQKGADAKQIRILDTGLKHFAQLIAQTLYKDIDATPGAGAAGGMGGAFIAFFNARLSRGIDTVLDALHFNEKLQGADLVITGEGKMDAQTIMGKAPMGVPKAAQRKNIPVIGIAGCVDETELLNNAGFLAVYPIVEGPVSQEQAMEKSRTCSNIERTVHQCMRMLSLLHN